MNPERIQELAEKAGDCCREISAKVRDQEVSRLASEAARCCSEIRDLARKPPDVT